MLKNDLATRLVYLTRTKALEAGRRLHLELKQDGYDSHTFLGNHLVNMYGSSGSLQEARDAFDRIYKRNVFSWNILISAFVHSRHLGGVREAFERMPCRNVVSGNTFLACLVQNDCRDEARVVFEGLPERDTATWNTILAAYAQMGHLEQAREIFERIQKRDLITHNTMLYAFVINGRLPESLELFHSMATRDFVSWNTVFTSLTHEEGEFPLAKTMFERLPQWDVLACTDMLQAFAQHGYIHEARDLFDQMPQRDVVAWTGMLRSFAANGDLPQARNVFNRMPERDEVSCTAMLTELAEKGQLSEAKEVFERMPYSDSVAWTAMVTAYARNGQSSEALNLFRVMDIEGMHADHVTIVAVLDACASIPALTEGRLIHTEIIERGFESDVALSTAVSNMYARCGSFQLANDVFHQMPSRDKVSWNAHIAANARSGDVEGVLSMFRTMVLEGVQPCDSTLVSLLSALSHTGKVEDAREHFISASGSFHVPPTFELYMIMVDILGRAGQLERAEELANTMPFEADAASWRTLLGACRLQGDDARGSVVAESVVQLDQEDSASYVLLANLYVNQM